MKINIDILEEYLKDRYKGWVTEQGLFMKLAEELGEVAEVLNMRAGYKKSDAENLDLKLGEELCDMIHYIVAIAAINSIDLEKTMLKKDKAGSEKYNHEINLEEYIKSHSL